VGNPKSEARNTKEIRNEETEKTANKATANDKNGKRQERQTANAWCFSVFVVCRPFVCRLGRFCRLSVSFVFRASD
jgi:hypothetical protein